MPPPSPESAAGIKAGAKTGLSTLVCGILFGVATFFYPIFAGACRGCGAFSYHLFIMLNSPLTPY